MLEPVRRGLKEGKRNIKNRKTLERNMRVREKTNSLKKKGLEKKWGNEINIQKNGKFGKKW